MSVCVCVCVCQCNLLEVLSSVNVISIDCPKWANWAAAALSARFTCSDPWSSMEIWGVRDLTAICEQKQTRGESVWGERRSRWRPGGGWRSVETSGGIRRLRRERRQSVEGRGGETDRRRVMSSRVLWFTEELQRIMEGRERERERERVCVCVCVCLCVCMSFFYCEDTFRFKAS